MLQRYNYIRINNLIKRMKPKFEKRIEIIKEEIIKDDALIEEHEYELIDKKSNEKSISFDELISNMNVEELRNFQKYLKSI